MKCTQCHGGNIAARLRVLDQQDDDHQGDLALEANMSPQALFITDAISVPLIADVCTDCGNVMFSVRDSNDVEKIRNAADARQAVDNSDPDLKASPGFGSFLGSGGEDS